MHKYDTVILQTRHARARNNIICYVGALESIVASIYLRCFKIFMTEYLFHFIDKFNMSVNAYRIML